MHTVCIEVAGIEAVEGVNRPAQTDVPPPEGFFGVELQRK